MPKSVYNIKRAFVELMYPCDCDEIITAESRHDQNSMEWTTSDSVVHHQETTTQNEIICHVVEGGRKDEVYDIL